MDIIISSNTSKPIYEQIRAQIKAMIMSGELKAGDALPSIRSMARSVHISVLTVQKAYDLLQEDGFIETTAGKGCFVSVQNQDFYLEEQQKKIEEHFTEAIEIARMSGIKLDSLQSLLTYHVLSHPTVASSIFPCVVTLTRFLLTKVDSY